MSDRKSDKKVVFVRVKPEIHEALIKLAKDQDKSVNDIAKELLGRFVKRHKIMDLEIGK